MRVRLNHAHTRANRWSQVAEWVSFDREGASLFEMYCQPVRLFHPTYNNLTFIKVLTILPMHIRK